MCCSDIWDYRKRPDKPTGECSECGEPLYDGEPGASCTYSPVACETCGDAPCDGSC